MMLQGIQDSIGFVTDLDQKCRNFLRQKTLNQESQPWILVLVDGDETEIPSLASPYPDEKQHDVIITPEQEEKDITWLKRYLINPKNRYSYHLDGRLFALFINDSMDNSVELIQKLIKDSKNVLHHPLGIGMATLGIDYETIVSNEELISAEAPAQIQRSWVTRALINTLRAKESGGNCYFNNEKSVDSSKNNVDLTRMTSEANKYYSNYSMSECERIIYNVFDKFDENIILNQAITPDSILSVYFLLAKSLSFRRSHIGNKIYRAQKSFQLISKTLESFIRGNMTLECYYFYKSWQAEYWEDWKTAQNIKRPNKANKRKGLFDIHTLTRTEKLSKDMEEQTTRKFDIESTFYFSKLAFEHTMNTDNESTQIVFDFAQEASMYDETENLAIDKFYWVITSLLEDIKNNKVSTVDIAYPYSSVARVYASQGNYNESFKVMSTAMEHRKHHVWILCTMGNIYKSSVWDWNNDKVTESDRIDKAIEYYNQLMDKNIVDETKFLKRDMFHTYGELLYCWTKDCDSNEKTQEISAKMYEKAVKMDQSLGWDIINNWTRNVNKFPLELNGIIVQYWYYPKSRHSIEMLLNYGDLLQTHFKDNKEKMKIANIYCNIAGPRMKVVNAKGVSESKENDVLPLMSLKEVDNIRLVSLCHDIRTDADCVQFLSVAKPAKLNQSLAWNDYYSIRKEHLIPFGTVAHSFITDIGIDAPDADYDASDDDSDENKFAVSMKYVFKIAYFIAFMDSKDGFDNIGVKNGDLAREFEAFFDSNGNSSYRFNEDKLNDKIERFQCMMVQILMYGCFELELADKQFGNFYAMLVSAGYFGDIISTYFEPCLDNVRTANDVIDAQNTLILDVSRRLHSLCDQIYKQIDLHNVTVLKNLQDKHFLSPKIEILANIRDNTEIINKKKKKNNTHSGDSDDNHNDNNDDDTDDSDDNDEGKYITVREVYINDKKLINHFGNKNNYDNNILACSLLINDHVRWNLAINWDNIQGLDCLKLLVRCIASVYYQHG